MLLLHRNILLVKVTYPTTDLVSIFCEHRKLFFSVNCIMENEDGEITWKIANPFPTSAWLLTGVDCQMLPPVFF